MKYFMSTYAGADEFNRNKEVMTGEGYVINGWKYVEGAGGYIIVMWEKP